MVGAWIPMPVAGAMPLRCPVDLDHRQAEAVTSEKCSPSGLIRNRSSRPGINIEKWFEIPS